MKCRLAPEIHTSAVVVVVVDNGGPVVVIVVVGHCRTCTTRITCQALKQEAPMPQSRKLLSQTTSEQCSKKHAALAAVGDAGCTNNSASKQTQVA